MGIYSNSIFDGVNGASRFFIGVVMGVLNHSGGGGKLGSLLHLFFRYSRRWGGGEKNLSRSLVFLVQAHRRGVAVGLNGRLFEIMKRL